MAPIANQHGERICDGERFVKIAPHLASGGRADHSAPATRDSRPVNRHRSGVRDGSIRVRIEELVLHGFAHRDRHRIASAVEQELARLIGGTGPAKWQPSPPAIERISGGTFKVEPRAQPEKAGAEIARAVFRGFRRDASRAVAPSIRRLALGERNA
jgi:hypothetical protein